MLVLYILRFHIIRMHEKYNYLFLILNLLQGAMGRVCLSGQQMLTDLSTDGTVVAAGLYLCSSTTIYLISMTFHGQHSVQGPWAR